MSQGVTWYPGVTGVAGVSGGTHVTQWSSTSYGSIPADHPIGNGGILNKNTVAGSGSVGSATINGAITQSPNTIAGSGNSFYPTLVGTGAVTQSPNTVSGTASSTNVGTGAITQNPNTIAGSASPTDSGTGAVTQAPNTISGSGNATIPDILILMGGGDLLQTTGDLLLLVN